MKGYIHTIMFLVMIIVITTFAIHLYQDHGKQEHGLPAIVPPPARAEKAIPILQDTVPRISVTKGMYKKHFDNVDDIITITVDGTPIYADTWSTTLKDREANMAKHHKEALLFIDKYNSTR